MVDVVGVKDLLGDNVVLITRKNPLSKDFYDGYIFVDLSFIVGDGLANMRVDRRKK